MENSDKYSKKTNTNESINFIIDSLNKTSFGLLKEIPTDEKEKLKINLFNEQYSKEEQLITPYKLVKTKTNKTFNTNYRMYKKVPHKSDKLQIQINNNFKDQERFSDTSCFNVYKNGVNYKNFINRYSNKKNKSKTNLRNITELYGNNTFNNMIQSNKNIKVMKSIDKNNNKSKTKIKLMHNKYNDNKKNSFKAIPKISQTFDKKYKNIFILNNKINVPNELYIIDNDQEKFNQNSNLIKVSSTEFDFTEIIHSNSDKIVFNLLKLNERNWYKEAFELSDLLIQKRILFSENDINKYIRKYIKLYEHFNWLVNSIGNFFHSKIFENNIDQSISENEVNFDLPREIGGWFKGFKWKGLYVRVVPREKGKFIINEVKALNYFFNDFLQIISNYKNIDFNVKPKPFLSNYIIFPFISYMEINGFILFASAIIDYTKHILNNNINRNYLLKLDEIIQLNNGIIKLYTDLNFITISNESNNSDIKLFISIFSDKFNIKDLKISELFSRVNNSNVLPLLKGKFLLFNLNEFIPNIFELKNSNKNSIIKINLLSISNNKRSYYSLKYDTNQKNNNELLEIIRKQYKMNTQSIKIKNVIVNNLQFRILYQTQYINDKNQKYKKLVDVLFNYDSENNKYESYIAEPYVILYDLLEPIKMNYFLINKNPKTSNNFNVNYISHFLNWCRKINLNLFEIKNYHCLKNNMKQNGIFSKMKYFIIYNISNSEIKDIIKIYILVKAISFIINKKDTEKIFQVINTGTSNILTISSNNNNFNNSYNDIRCARLLYSIKAILYPSEILPVNKKFFDNLFQQLIFYMNIFFLKLKLIDDYLSLGFFNKNISMEFDSPKNFLKNIIYAARNKPFLFINELQCKLNFLVDNYILYKSSISIESMYKKLDHIHIKLNSKNNIYSFIKSDDIAGMIFVKIKKKYDTYEKSTNFEKDSEKATFYTKIDNFSYGESLNSNISVDKNIFDINFITDPKNFYLIQNQEFLFNYIDNTEMVFRDIFSCDNHTEKNLLEGYVFKFVILFFIEKNFFEAKNIINKILTINKKYTLTELAIINLIQGIISKDETFYSKSLILLLMEWGDPRGRLNNSHELLLYPLWEILKIIFSGEQFSIMFDYFNEMFLCLEYTLKNKINEFNSKNQNNYQINLDNNKENPINNICIKFPEINNKLILEKNENDFKHSKKFIIFLINSIQNLFINDKNILFDKKYIEEFILFETPKNNSFDNNDIKFFNNNTIKYRVRRCQSNINSKDINNLTYTKNNSNNNSTKSLKSKTIIFSDFLQKILFNKLSYKLNAPSGVIVAFGNNSHNETCLDNKEKITRPHIIFKLKNKIIDHIYSGWEHNIVIDKNGEIYSFGHNHCFQCGVFNSNDSEKNILDPVNISKLNNNIQAIKASCGNEHSLILSNEHIVYSFGNNEDGVLGQNIIKTNNNMSPNFLKINFNEYTNKIIDISSGTAHNLALTFDGKIYSWGSNQGSQLGIPENILQKEPSYKSNFYIFTPIQILINNKIEKISCGEAHSLILTNEGKVFTWGFGSNGQLGLGFCEDTFEPGQGLTKSIRKIPEIINDLSNENIIDVQCGKTFSMFINNKKELFACGVNDLLQLGTEDLSNNDEFLFNKSEKCFDFIFPIKIESFLNMKVEKISCGEGHCLAIIKDKLTNNLDVWSWGNNKFGQLGHWNII